MPSQALLTTALPHSPPRPRHGSALPPAAFSLELAPRLTPHHWSPAHTGPGGILYGLAAPQMATFVLHAQAGGGYTPGAEKPGRTDGPRPSTSTLAPSSGPGPAGRPLASHASLPPLRSRGASRPPPTLRLASRSPGQTPSRLLLLRGDPPRILPRGARAHTHVHAHTHTQHVCALSCTQCTLDTYSHTRSTRTRSLTHTQLMYGLSPTRLARTHTYSHTAHAHMESLHTPSQSQSRSHMCTHTYPHSRGTCTPSPTVHTHTRHVHTLTHSTRARPHSMCTRTLSRTLVLPSSAGTQIALPQTSPSQAVSAPPAQSPPWHVL